MFAQHTVWKEFPGHTMRRENQVEAEKLHELRRGSEESMHFVDFMVEVAQIDSDLGI